MRAVHERLSALAPQRSWLPSAIAIGAAVSVVAAILRVEGADPFSAFVELFRGAFGAENLPATLVILMPMLGMTVAMVIPIRARILNLGGDGQMVFGGITAVVVGSTLPGPAGVVIPVTLVCAMVVGGAWGWVAAALSRWANAPLLVISLLLSYPALGFAAYLTAFPLRDQATSLLASKQLPSAARLPMLWPGSTVSFGLALVLIAAAAVIWWSRTPHGFEARMTRQNASFTRYMGINLPQQASQLMFASGAVAGLVGAMLVMSSPFRYVDGALTRPLYTWMAFTIVLLVRAKPLAAFLGALFLAALRTGGANVERIFQVPQSITELMTGLILLGLAAVAGRSLVSTGAK
jgi:simple sugar transport system permease protein